MDRGPDPASAERLAEALEGNADFRVMRRMWPMRRTARSHRGLRYGVALDVETTGLDVAGCRIIELALQTFHFDAEGRIVETGRPHGWLEDPGVPLTPTISKLTGLTDADLAGRSIMEPVAGGLLRGADLIVAHNAGFDRGFVEGRLPWVAGGRWACSMRDVDWRELGFDGRSLGHLLGQCGWFYQAHRAGTDVTALLHLLDHRLDDGGTVLARLWENASRPTWRIEAVEAPFEAKELLRARGYRWDAPARCWSREVDAREKPDELGWLAVDIYSGECRARCVAVDWTTRYARR